MLVLITYDVSTSDAKGKARLRKVAKQCVNYGQRVQNSVFECVLDPGQCKMLKAQLLEIIDTDKDSLRFYSPHGLIPRCLQRLERRSQGWIPRSLLRGDSLSGKAVSK